MVDIYMDMNCQQICKKNSRKKT